jgi:hypothetical protein
MLSDPEAWVRTHWAYAPGQARGKHKFSENGEARRAACGWNVIRQVELGRQRERGEYYRLLNIAPESRIRQRGSNEVRER